MIIQDNIAGQHGMCVLECEPGIMRNGTGTGSHGRARSVVTMGGMRTLTLRGMQQPSYLDTLLDALVAQIGVLPENAHPIRDPGNLPAALRRIASMATHVGQSWACWANERDHWLFVAELPLTRGTPVLQLDQYNEHGELRASSKWHCDDNDQWLRSTD